MADEIELKLEVRPGQLAKLAKAPWLRRLMIGPAKTERLESVYYDTADLALREQHAILRVRKCGDTYTQAFKAESPGGGLARLEWECSLKDERPKFRHAAKKETGGVDLKKLANKLKPIFKTDVQRRILPLRFRGSEIELALDHGEVRTGRRRQPIHEAELELKHGNPRSVIALGREIATRTRATYGIASKAERGYNLRAGRAEEPTCTHAIALSNDMNAGEAFQAVAMACLHHFAGNGKAIIGEKTEGVHQMRVGLRRLRAAISLFKDVLPGPETDQIKSSLKWLTEELGTARDMDVMAEEGVAALTKGSVFRKAAVALKADVANKRKKGFARAKRAVASLRYHHLVLDIVLWINGGRWLESRSTRAASLRKIAATRYVANEMPHRRKKVLKMLKTVERLTPLKLHKLRIAIKKLRYATEFFESIYGEHKAAKKLAAVLEDLQSSLGHLNDTRVHGQLAKTYFAPTRRRRGAVKRAFAMGELMGGEKAKAKELFKTAKNDGNRLKKVSELWN